ncbi:SDR family oxidoreductase [Caldimonas thermodepolymerans]|jgi:NAD(P)-dependent dehydrogenase (short-subunit alcohol dehydrogenase family)|uniref:3-oxoacyl-[acyl-carrier protein] reductase n=1 Tax=Caldimonas thermodepolymerans TaxID=215580 RepID=A0A2S5T5B7_9BURK|nr:SDR family NAD(P)-dependent oxidoreductase [Caldimonas thermodepolymerans]PPE70146.1 short-chain dehydrogenase [Caldimonas thermodepolymerans]QPC32140.1 SDR family oxidoreductase [Caldimonas thermodepolymerans]RDH98026.1 3-oxoacyl-[acyl-carrier protein] reductase [Caldimonas thermodepolymerans]TCP08199.1 3-oxoacyl-[acyl-carrier protein] reductase [Caldimonas thermodepolymerans]UZG44942.1 SDR family oxidoreductase [Caldimonas thermodepolymerans]
MGARLQGKVALVTGAGGGIGRSIAQRLAAEGAALVLLDLHDDAMGELAEALRRGGTPVSTHCADVADAQQVRAAVEAARAALGPVDCLVNNAGLTAVIAPLERMGDEDWARELAVNLTGPFHLIRAVLPDMVARRWGRIVNISSAAARGGLFRQAGYSASKSGLLGLTRNVTLEYAAQGITCNAILPGLIATPTVEKLPPPVFDYAMSTTPARRPGRTEEVAALVAFLCSDEAAYLNGAEIDIDGGSRLCPAVLGSTREVAERLALAQGQHRTA